MKPGVILYSTVVSAYAAVGDMANARRVVAEMSDRKVRPNERTFSHLAWGYGQLGDVAGITQTAQLMADEGVSMRPGGQGRAALVRAVRECGLPASHVDRLLDSLAPSRRQGRRRGKTGGTKTTEDSNRWTRGTDNRLRRSSNDSSSSSSSFDDSVPPAAVPAKARAGGGGVKKRGYGAARRGDESGPVTRHGDAGWVMSATPRTGVRVSRCARGAGVRAGRVRVGLRARDSAGFAAPSRGVPALSFRFA
jgi:pentatricopeptide repeat protein